MNKVNLSSHLKDLYSNTDRSYFYINSLNEILNERYSLLETEWEKDKERQKLINEFDRRIIEFLKEHFYYLPIDIILEAVTYLGPCINLVYDDNGHWAVSTGGMQSMPKSLDDTDDIAISAFVEKNFWKDTIIEAVKYFLDNYYE